MFPYFWGGDPASGSTGLTYTAFMGSDLGLRDLPEEVRAALEDRKDEIHSADDLRRLADELMLRK